MPRTASMPLSMATGTGHEGCSLAFPAAIKIGLLLTGKNKSLKDTIPRKSGIFWILSHSLSKDPKTACRSSCL